MEPRRSDRYERGSRWFRKGLWQWTEHCGFEPPYQRKLDLKEEVIDHFQEGRGRKVEASWRRGHRTRFHAPSCLLVCLLLGIETPSYPLGRAALAGWPEMLGEKRVWSHLR